MELALAKRGGKSKKLNAIMLHACFQTFLEFQDLCKYTGSLSLSENKAMTTHSCASAIQVQAHNKYDRMICNGC